MNTVRTFLTRRWQALGLEGYGAPSDFSYVALTPRFRASAHVVFLILHPRSSEPVLVAKLSRLPGEASAIEREARNLRVVQAARPGGFASIPRLVAVETFAGTRLLVETAVPGRALDWRMVRRTPSEVAARVVSWTVDLHRATAHAGTSHDHQVRDLLQTPLAECRRAFDGSGAVGDLVERTAELTSPLAGTAFPLVFTHGDLSAPNILVSPTGQVGVVDWELGEPQGLPGQDLFFALTYLASASRRASRVPEYVAAFHEAFFGRRAWAQPYIAQYASVMRLPGELLRPLFLASWAVHVKRTLDRLGEPQAGTDRDTARWLMESRFMAVWRHAVEHWEELALLPDGDRVAT